MAPSKPLTKALPSAEGRQCLPAYDARTGHALTGGNHAERSDARRNRLLVLQAAAELFASRGVDSVTMDDVAALAGVGKGTLYRRFGDRSGLAAALLDERERALQRELIAGAPPVGPGAPPGDRLAAFTGRYTLFICANLDIVSLSESNTPGARHRTGAHRFWIAHSRLLLRAAGAIDPSFKAEALLAALAGEQIGYWIRHERRTPDELADSLSSLARAFAIHTS